MTWEIKVRKKPKPKPKPKKGIPWKTIGIVGGAIGAGLLGIGLSKKKKQK